MSETARIEQALRRIADPTEMSGDGDPYAIGIDEMRGPAARELWARINTARQALGMERIDPWAGAAEVIDIAAALAASTSPQAEKKRPVPVESLLDEDDLAIIAIEQAKGER